MAFCPECKEEIAQTATVCDHCGYDFPPMMFESKTLSTGIAYSGLATLALIIGQVVSVITALLSFFGAFFCLFHLNILGIVYLTVAFFMAIANFVVFSRVLDLDKR